MTQTDEIIVYTDGGCRLDKHIGSWAAIISAGGSIHELSGGERDTTNNRMELSAAINALSFVSQDPAMCGKKVRLFCDSQYVKNGITVWIKNWKRNGWRTASKKSVLNQDLWVRLDELCAATDVQWCWVRGHSGDEMNERCDALCNIEMDKLERQG